MKHRINENDMAIDPVGLMNKGLSVGDVIDVVMAPRHTIPGTENIQEHTPDASFPFKDDIGAHEQPTHNIGIGADTAIQSPAEQAQP